MKKDHREPSREKGEGRREKVSKTPNPSLNSSLLPGPEPVEGPPAFSLYLHVPFCQRLCPYCHFYRIPEVPPWEEYLDAVKREIEALGPENLGPCGLGPGDSSRIHTIYVGGGTPTLLPPEFYSEFLRFTGNRFDISCLAEATIETDGDVTPELLSGYAHAGFDRVSVGVKSFHPQLREILGAGELAHPDPVAAARAAGFGSVSIDLIYSVEGQTLDDLVKDLEQALNCDPDHISLYALEEPEAGKPEECEPDLSAAMFRESARLLGAAGFRQYEITNFSRPGHRSWHNMVYWQDGDFIGLGPSAHSSFTLDDMRLRWRNRPDLAAYLSSSVACREEVSREKGGEKAREALILALRMTEGVHRPSFTLKYGFDPLEFLKSHLSELLEPGLIRFSANRMRLTKRGMLLSNEVFLRILEDD
jgi:oxygen-independent coproporphyrinogen-3 oxidase